MHCRVLFKCKTLREITNVMNVGIYIYIVVETGDFTVKRPHTFCEVTLILRSFLSPSGWTVCAIFEEEEWKQPIDACGVLCCVDTNVNFCTSSVNSRQRIGSCRADYSSMKNKASHISSLEMSHMDRWTVDTGEEKNNLLKKLCCHRLCTRMEGKKSQMVPKQVSHQVNLFGCTLFPHRWFPSGPPWWRQTCLSWILLNNCEAQNQQNKATVAALHGKHQHCLTTVHVFERLCQWWCSFGLCLCSIETSHFYWET